MKNYIRNMKDSGITKKADIQLSFGAELEWSDIDRRVDIPKELGSWEGPKIAGFNLGSELDICNTKGEWRGIATDPLCVKCPVGGEIHVNPSYTIESQMIRIMRIMNLFDTIGVSCVNHGHIHVGVPGLRQNLELIKNVFEYTRQNEAQVLRACCGYDEAEYSEINAGSLEEWVKDYLIIGDAKSISRLLYEKIEASSTVEEALSHIKNTCCDEYDWVMDRRECKKGSHRTCINLYNLVKADTIEFRVFRASINPVEIFSTLAFSARYVEEALKGKDGKPVSEILKEGNFRFPKLNFDFDIAEGWQQTRSGKGRSGCLKHFTGTSLPVEDDLVRAFGLPNEEEEDEEVGMWTILKLCMEDFKK